MKSFNFPHPNFFHLQNVTKVSKTKLWIQFSGPVATWRILNLVICYISPTKLGFLNFLATQDFDMIWTTRPSLSWVITHFVHVRHSWDYRSYKVMYNNRSAVYPRNKMLIFTGDWPYASVLLFSFNIQTAMWLMNASGKQYNFCFCNFNTNSLYYE